MKRDPVIDSLRGLLVVYMFLQHLIISSFTELRDFGRALYYPFGWVPAAAGFIFISGFVIGMRYGFLLQRKGSGALGAAARKQTREIYFTHLGTLVLVAVGMQVWPEMAAGRIRLMPLAEEPVRQSVLGAMLLYQPDFFDILPMYFFYLLVTPLLLEEFRAGRALPWLGLSLGVWACAQWGLDPWLREIISQARGAFLGLFNPLGWQVVYVGGLYLGYRRQDGPGLMTRLPPSRRTTLAIVAGGVAFLFFVLRWEIFLPLPEALSDHMVSGKPTFPPLMAVNFAVFVYLFALVATRYPRIFTWRWLGFVGKHPLICFTFHLVIVSYLMIWRDEIVSLGHLANYVLLALVVGTITAPAWIEEWWQQRRVRQALAALNEKRPSA